MLKRNGFEVSSAYNGQEALTKTRDQQFDLILLDLRMPKMDGVEFLKKLKPAKNAPNTKIIIFSNYDDQTEVNEAVKHGATRYILKAWSSPGELVKIVTETISGQAS